MATRASDNETVMRRRVDAQFDDENEVEEFDNVGVTDDIGYRSQRKEEEEGAENVIKDHVNTTSGGTEGWGEEGGGGDTRGTVEEAKGPEFDTDTLSAPTGRQFLNFVLSKVIGKLLRAGYLVVIQGVIMLFSFIIKVITKRA